MINREELVKESQSGGRVERLCVMRKRALRALLCALPFLFGSIGCDSTTAPEEHSSKPRQASPEASPEQTPGATGVEVALMPDGLGIVDLGAEPRTVIDRITREHGPPDEDTGYVPSFSIFGTCPGERVRGVRWKSLLVLFTDGTTDFRSDGKRHFFSYRDQLFDIHGRPTRSLGLMTAEGIGLGSTVEHLRTAYGDRLEISRRSLPGLVDRWTVQVEAGSLGGTLSGETATVQAILGGFGCAE